MDGFTIATVVAWNGKRGIAYDAYDNVIWFTREQVHPEDVLFLHEGMKVCYNYIYSIEIVSASFLRFEALLNKEKSNV